MQQNSPINQIQIAELKAIFQNCPCFDSCEKKKKCCKSYKGGGKRCKKCPAA